MTVRVVDLRSPGRPLAEYGSSAGEVIAVIAPSAGVSVVSIRLGRGGRVGRHRATERQLFWVVEGSGWASGGDGRRVRLAAGQAAVFEAGEDHECGTGTGLAAVVVEGHDLALRL